MTLRELIARIFHHFRPQTDYDVAALPLVDRPLYGYFGAANYLPTEPVAIAEIAGHVNLGFLGSWACTAESLAAWHIAQMRAGVAAGVTKFCNTIDVLVYNEAQDAPWSINPSAEANLRAYLSALEATGLLGNVIALYPVDEPNMANRLTEAEIIQTNALIRRVLVDYGCAMRIRLAVIYSGLADMRASATYDWIGGDDYNAGVAILEQYEALLPKLKPGQQLLLVPPGHSAPTPYYNFAQLHPGQVAAIVPFKWFGTDEYSVSTNGRASVYKGLGILLTRQ